MILNVQAKSLAGHKGNRRDSGEPYHPAMVEKRRNQQHRQHCPQISEENGCPKSHKGHPIYAWMAAANIGIAALRRKNQVAEPTTTTKPCDRWQNAVVAWVCAKDRALGPARPRAERSAEWSPIRGR